MFCHKCGMQSVEAAEFCQHCGSKLIVENNTQHISKVSDPIIKPRTSEQIQSKKVEYRYYEPILPQTQNVSIPENTAKPAEPEPMHIPKEEPQVASHAVSPKYDMPVKAPLQEKKKVAVVLVPCLIIIAAAVVTIFVLLSNGNKDNQSGYKEERPSPSQNSNNDTPENQPQIKEEEEHTFDNDGFKTPEIDALASMIESYIGENGLEYYARLVYDDGILLLTIYNDSWFESGSAEVEGYMWEHVAVLAMLIAETFNEENPFKIVVAGHTDNVPINTVRYPSNWHVSIARAMSILEVFIFDSGLDPAYFYATGCGDMRPVADNDTEEGRRMNRRTEIKISMAGENS